MQIDIKQKNAVSHLDTDNENGEAKQWNKSKEIGTSTSGMSFTWYPKAHLPTMNCAVLVLSRQSTQFVLSTPVFQRNKKEFGL